MSFSYRCLWLWLRFTYGRNTFELTFWEETVFWELFHVNETESLNFVTSSSFKLYSRPNEVSERKMGYELKDEIPTQKKSNIVICTESDGIGASRLWTVKSRANRTAFARQWGLVTQRCQLYSIQKDDAPIGRLKPDGLVELIGNGTIVGDQNISACLKTNGAGYI